jgi:hypothetical protein
MGVMRYNARAGDLPGGRPLIVLIDGGAAGSALGGVLCGVAAPRWPMVGAVSQALSHLRRYYDIEKRLITASVGLRSPG